MTQLLLIRHGSNDIMARKLAGRAPGVHLNDAGRFQALTLAEILHPVPITAIYSSPLERAVETAEPVAKSHHLPIQIRQALSEVDFGAWVGKTYPQLMRTKLWKAIQEAPSQVRFPGGESFPEAQQRVITELNTITAAHPEEEIIAVFSHADLIRLAIAHFLNMPLDAFQRLPLDTASITALNLPKSGAPRFWLINQLAHLEFSPPEKTKE